MHKQSGRPLLRMIHSARLNLIAATTDLVKMDIEGKTQLADALGVSIPESWPPELYGPGAMTYSLAQLGDATEPGWSFWYLVKKDQSGGLVGICGFKGRPDEQGSVEIGYSMLKCFQRQGFATEAVASLVGWAFTHHNVVEVCAETLPHLSQSIRVLEKCGFKYTGQGSESGVIRYAINRSSLN